MWLWARKEVSSWASSVEEIVGEPGALLTFQLNFDSIGEVEILFWDFDVQAILLYRWGQFLPSVEYHVVKQQSRTYISRCVVREFNLVLGGAPVSSAPISFHRDFKKVGLLLQHSVTQWPSA